MMECTFPLLSSISHLIFPSPLTLTITMYLFTSWFLIVKSSPIKWLIMFGMPVYVWLSTPIIKGFKYTLNLCGLSHISSSSSYNEASLAWKNLILHLSLLFPTLETCPFFFDVCYLGHFDLPYCSSMFVVFFRIDCVFYQFPYHHFIFPH